MIEFWLLLGAGLLWMGSLWWLSATVAFALLQPVRRRRARAPVEALPVSIVVPTSAASSPRSSVERAAALSSLLRLDYPSYEIIVCIDRGDQDGPLATELRRSFPQERVRVIVARTQSSANAKVDAMASGAEEARYELVLFSDDDVILDRQHLSRLAAQLTQDVGLVSSAAVGIRPENLWGELEIAFMGGQFARLHLAGDFLGFGGALGKSILVRKTDIGRAGGLPRIGGDCCEDAALTQNLAACGRRTVLGDRAVLQPIGRQRFIDVWRRHRRWLSCRRSYIPATFACEALFSTPTACLAGVIVFKGLSLDPRAAVAITIALWCMIDCLFVILNRWNFSVLTPIAWAIREAIFLPLWVSALFARTVTWYGRRVPVTAGEHMSN